MKNISNLLLIISVLGLAGLACSDPKNNQPTQKTSTANSTTQVAEKPLAISAKELVKSYKENEIAADGKYKDKLLAVSGKVSNIAETFGQYSVQLEGSDMVVSVNCSFADSEKEAIAKLKKGQTATLIGKADGMTAGLYVGLVDCKIQ